MKLIMCETQRLELEREIIAGNFESCLIKSLPLIKQIIWTLVIHEVPFKKINYGSGVVKIIRKEVETEDTEENDQLISDNAKLLEQIENLRFNLTEVTEKEQHLKDDLIRIFGVSKYYEFL